MFIPPQITVVPKFLIMSQLNLVDTYAGIILQGLFTPFALFMFRQFFLSIPVEIEEAAIIDGCSRLKTYLKIILPLSKPVFAAMAIFRFTFCWNELFWPLIIINSERLKPLQVGLATFKVEGQMQYHLLMAATTIAVIPTFIVLVLFQRYFVKGQLLGGLKL